MDEFDVKTLDVTTDVVQFKIMSKHYRGDFDRDITKRPVVQSAVQLSNPITKVESAHTSAHVHAHGSFVPRLCSILRPLERIPLISSQTFHLGEPASSLLLLLLPLLPPSSCSLPSPLGAPILPNTSFVLVPFPDLLVSLATDAIRVSWAPIA